MALLPELEDHRIAMTGMHVEASGVKNLEDFRRAVLNGEEKLEHLTEDALDRAGVGEKARKLPDFIPAAMAMDNIDHFDAKLFNISPHDAALIDPQIRRFLQGAWTALDHAGIDPARYDGKIGVYAGATLSSYLLESVSRGVETGPAELYMNSSGALATFVSHHLGLRGPSIGVHTLCSTGLVAVHLACRALIDGECDVAIAGGVAISVSQRAGFRTQPGLYFSPDGHTRTI